jgi:hypothetical protein
VNRLVASSNIDDTQPPHAQCYRTIDEGSFVIRPAMGNGIAHRTQPFHGGFALKGPVIKSDYTTHIELRTANCGFRIANLRFTTAARSSQRTELAMVQRHRTSAAACQLVIYLRTRGPISVVSATGNRFQTSNASWYFELSTGDNVCASPVAVRVCQ